MTTPKLRVALAFVVLTVLTGHGYQGPAGKAWPPGVQKVSNESPVLSPADEMKTFFMPAGYHVELVVSEPMIQDPILVDWDPDGRMWVIEMPGYMHDIIASDEHNPTGRIVVLEDTNHDGTMDKRTVFADGLILPRALKVLDHGVLVGEPPNLWLMHDTNGDLKMDTKELVTDTYGRLDASVEHNTNSLTWALDNWLHTSESDMYLRLKDGKFEVRKTLSRGQWGNSQDDAGHIFRNSNETVLHVDLVPTPYFMRNPNLLRTRGSYESLEGDNSEVNVVFPARPTPGVNRGYQDGVLKADGTLNTYTSVHSPTVYRGDRLPKDVYGDVFVAEPAGNTVSRIIVDDDGSTLQSTKAYDKAEFLTSTDERFRPVYLSSAPDGTLYVVDIYRGIIQHRGYITEYLRDQIQSRKLEQPTGLGRIYRVVHDSTRRDTAPALSKATSAQLVTTLSHPNGWWRDTAQRLLVERGDKSVVPALTRLAETAPDMRTRLHALWTLDGTDSLTPATVIKALGDESRDVRTNALRLAERFLPDGKDANLQVRAAVVARMNDADWSVRQQLAASLGAMPVGARETAVATLLSRHADDPITVDAAISGVRGTEAAVIQNLLPLKDETPQVATAMTMLAATVMRGAQDAAAQSVFTWAADESRPTWQRAALLRGAEAAILNAGLPGNPAGGRRGGGGTAAGAAPCPTCPGARGGPGGAAAFPTGRGAGAAGAPAAAAAGEGAPAAAAAPGGGRGGGRAGGGGGGRGGGGGPALRLNREPAALIALAGKGGDLGTRATAVLARVEWPGKPGAAAPVTPLTPEEQKRFDAGEEVYKNLCQACHQPDGRGQDKLAATLIGSALALGPAEVTARILLNGKEGKIGLMPPLGTALNDDQIAGALTYIRRQWGQTASPVDPALVKQIRALTAGRTRPWTDAELLALPGVGRGGF